MGRQICIGGNPIPAICDQCGSTSLHRSDPGISSLRDVWIVCKLYPSFVKNTNGKDQAVSHSGGHPLFLGSRLREVLTSGTLLITSVLKSNRQILSTRKTAWNRQIYNQNLSRLERCITPGGFKAFTFNLS